MELRRRGGYLVMLVVLLGAALMFLGVSLLSYVNGQRQLALRLEREWVAEAAARAGLERARQELARNSDWRQGFADLVQPTSQGHCVVTFQPGTTPYSTNNVHGSSTVRGYEGRRVPPGQAHLVATGSSGSHTFVAQALVAVSGVLLTCDFAAGAAGWTELPGQTLQGVYRLGATRAQATFAGSPTWRDYTLEVKARHVSGPGTFSLWARSRWGSERTGVEFSYDPNTDVFALQQIRLERRRPADRAQGFHVYRLSVTGERAVASLDGLTLCSAPLPADLVQGRVGLSTAGGACWEVDEVRVFSSEKVQYTARW